MIAKSLANKIKGVMPKLVGESQFTFVDGRQILNGVLLANKVVCG